MALTLSDFYKALRGVFCVYKPTGLIIEQVVDILKTNIVRDLNLLHKNTTRQLVVFNTDDNESSVPAVTTVPDLSDNPLVLGPHFVKDDFPIYYVHRLTKNSSGVSVMCIGDGARQSILGPFAKTAPLRVYHVKGCFGLATQDFTPEGHVIERTTFDHINRAKLDRVLSALQAGHQKHMFVAAGVDIQSQEAYELAAKGLVRPKNKESGPIIYGLKCITFQPPDFVLEVHSINETGNYLGRIIHTVGLLLRSSAVCTHIHRIRCGRFSVDHALLRKHWTAEHILNNITLCKPLLSTVKQKTIQLDNTSSTVSVTNL